MKVLVISNLYPPFVIGGYELNCAIVVRELRARGHEVLVATTPSHIPGPADPAHVRRPLSLRAFVPTYGGSAELLQSQHSSAISNFDNAAALHALLADFAPDIVFFWNIIGVGALHLIDLTNLHGVPWAIYLGDRVYADIVEAAPEHVRAIFRGHDPAYFASGAIMAVSQHLVDEITRVGQFAFAIAPTIVHSYAATSGPRVEHVYRRDGRIRCVYAGIVRQHKGITLICHAVAKLVANGVDDFEVNIFGDGNVAFYVNYANTLGIAHRLHFHGHVAQSELRDQFQSHDLFLFPTWSREPFGKAPFEAAAYGCVPIVTADSGCAERIVDNVHGIKIERTAEAIADAIRRTIDGSIDLERIGTAAATMVRSDMSLSGYVDRVEAILSDRCVPRERPIVGDPRALLLAFVKHHLSLALRFGATD